MLWRMRWLFLSIVLVYLWAAPLPDSRLIIIALADGLLQAARLALLVAAVVLLLQTTPRPSLVSSLYWLTAPLARLGFDRGHFALRVVLVLERVTEVQALATESRERRFQGGRFDRIAAMASELFATVVERAGREPLQELSLEIDRLPPLWQWGIPLALVAVVGVAASLA